MGKNKYSTEVKNSVLAEYFKGSCPKDLQRKYNVGQAAFWSWVKKERRIKAKATPSLVDITEVMAKEKEPSEKLTMSYQGYEIKFDIRNLEKVLKVIKNV